MLKEAYESLNKEDEEIPLRIKLKDAVFSAIKLLEDKDPLASMRNAAAICGGKYRHIHAQEQWPQMIHVYRPHDATQILLPECANTLAVEAYLRICGLPYKIEPRKNAEYMSPSGRVPFIKCGAHVIPDFEHITTFISSQGKNLSHNLTDSEKGEMRAYISLINNGLFNAEQYVCWMDPLTLNGVTKPTHGGVYPWPLNHIINWEKERLITKRLKVLGWGNKTLDEVYAEVEMCCTALTDRLNKKPYFFGEKPSAIDALIFGHVRAISTFSSPTPSIQRLAAILRSFPEILNHVYNISNRYFRDWSDDGSTIDDFVILNYKKSSSSVSSSIEDLSPSNLWTNEDTFDPITLLFEHDKLFH